MTEDKADGSMTVKDVAQRWGCNEDVVYREIRGGRLRSFTLGNRVYRIRPEWVVEYEERQAPTGSKAAEGSTP